MSSGTIAVKASEAVPLKKAWLCLNCELISEPRNLHCTLCGSAQLIYIQQVLDSREDKGSRI